MEGRVEHHGLGSASVIDSDRLPTVNSVPVERIKMQVPRVTRGEVEGQLYLG